MKKDKLIKSIFPRLFIGIFMLLTLFGTQYSQPLSKVDAQDPNSWSGTTCDIAHYSGSTPLNNMQGGGVNPWSGIIACGPEPKNVGDVYKYENIGSGSVQWEWECVELVMRYLALNYGVTPYSANGNSIVSAYNNSSSRVVAVQNNGSSLPGVGDVLSYDGVHIWWPTLSRHKNRLK